jgi:hypothetical protein
LFLLIKNLVKDNKMNNVQYLLSCIQRQIPKEILSLCFIVIPGLDRLAQNKLAPSLEYVIQTEIINKWVLTDCNVVAGVEAIIDITRVKSEHLVSGIVLHVGLEPTDGRLITAVLSIGYGFNGLQAGAPGIVSSYTEPVITSDARIQLIGQNIVYVEGYIGVQLTTLRCILENDNNFNNIGPRALPILSDLCVLATKAHIYNTLSVKLSNAVNVNGIDMGKIADIVNEYSDSITTYKELLNTKWFKVNFMNDRVSYNRHIRRITPY